MIDILASKVTTPAALFAILSPGLLLQLPDKLPFRHANAISSMRTSRTAVVTHACVLVLLYHLISKPLGLVLTKTDLIVVGTLFALLSPGMLVTIPPGAVMSGQTSLTAIAVHTLVFAVVFAFLRSKFPAFY
jgi:hypothetical protein